MSIEKKTSFFLQIMSHTANVLNTRQTIFSLPNVGKILETELEKKKWKGNIKKIFLCVFHNWD